MALVTLQELLDSGVHFGHQTRRWNPKMRRFILGERNGIYLIDLHKTLAGIEAAYAYVRDLVADGGTILFVGTKKQTQGPIADYAEACGMPFVNQRWLGGMLTNFTTVHGRVKRLVGAARHAEAGDFANMPKREALRHTRELEKLDRNLSGIAGLDKVPDADLRDRHEEGAHRRHRGQEARPARRGRRRHQLRPRRDRLRHPRQRRRDPRRRLLCRSWPTPSPRAAYIRQNRPTVVAPERARRGRDGDGLSQLERTKEVVTRWRSPRRTSRRCARHGRGHDGREEGPEASDGDMAAATKLARASRVWPRRPSAPTSGRRGRGRRGARRRRRRHRRDALRDRLRRQVRGVRLAGRRDRRQGRRRRRGRDRGFIERVETLLHDAQGEHLHRACGAPGGRRWRRSSRPTRTCRRAAASSPWPWSSRRERRGRPRPGGAHRLRQAALPEPRGGAPRPRSPPSAPPSRRSRATRASLTPRCPRSSRGASTAGSRSASCSSSPSPRTRS